MSDGAAKLVLRVRHQPDPSARVSASVQFGADGGTVGRSGRCDLVLPDPSNLVSRQHLEIVFDAGRFHAVDTSANGLFVNGGGQSVGEGNRVALNEGDRLSLGAYELHVETLAAGADPGPANAISGPPPQQGTLSGNPFAREAGERREPPPDGLPDIPDADGPAHSSDGDAGDDPFGVPAELARDPFEDDLGGPMPGASGDNREPVAPSVGPPEPDADTPIIPEDYDPLADLLGGADPQGSADGLPQHDHTPGWRAPIGDAVGTPRQPARDTSGDVAADQAPDPAAAPRRGPEVDGASAGLTAFCRGAGIGANDLDASDPEAVLERAGAVFAQLGEGLTELLQARAAFKQEFRVQRTVLGPSDNNPLKFGADPARAPKHLLTAPAHGYMPPERAVAEAITDVKDHEVALVAAMHRALAHVLAEFEPNRLEGRLEGMSVRDILPGGRQARYWALYREHYDRIARGAEDIFEGALGREFVRAYEESERRS